MVVCTYSVAKDLKVGTGIAPPYQLKIGDSVGGSVVDLVQCVLEKSSVPYSISVYPWKRNTRYLKSDKLDVVFSLIENSDLDTSAVFSAPLVLEKWYWYGKNKLNPKKKDMAISVVSGSNQEAWLKGQGYTKVKPVSSLNSAMKMMSTARVDSLLTDRESALIYSKESGDNLDNYNAKFQRFSELGAYISKAYASTHPDFLANFNKNIFSCKPVGVVLDNSSLSALKDIATDITQWMNNGIVLSGINEANAQHKNISEADIILLDKQWRKEKKSKQHKMISTTLANNVSAYLKKIKKDNDGLYSEIFVMDEHGMNVGQSDITSDYWQGDEAKFKKSFSGDGGPFIDDIEYDESSRTFQSQISLAIVDLASNKRIGAITVGVNIERALESSD